MAGLQTTDDTRSGYLVGRLGLLGGTFDPIHIGHLVLAEAAAEELRLDLVLFVPAGNPPHKQGRAITAASHRLRMVELAVAGNPRFAVSTVDLSRSGPSYTADTLALIQGQYPNSRLFFITGADALLEMPTWHKPEEILSRCEVAGASRPGFDLKCLETSALYHQYSSRIHLFSAPLLDISSTNLRQRVACGMSIRYLVPDGVYEYIHRHGLYQDSLL